MIGLHQELGYSELERAGTLERNPSSEQTPVPLRTAAVALPYLARRAEEQGPKPGLSVWLLPPARRHFLPSSASLISWFLSAIPT